jgi:hypothetical protein
MLRDVHHFTDINQIKEGFMPKSSWIRPAVSAITMAAFSTCLSLSAHAADLYSSAEISGLTYRLIDLDPNDGIAPSITFNSTIQLSTNNLDGSESYSGSLLPTAVLTSTNAGAMASASPSSLSAASSLNASEALSQLDPAAGGYQYASVDHAASITSYDLWWTSSTITLSANTAIQITGLASLSGGNNLTSLRDALSALPHITSSSVSGFATSTISLSLNKSTYESVSDVLTLSKGQFASFAFQGIWTDGREDPLTSKAFSLYYGNASDTEEELSLDLQIASDVFVNVNADFNDSTNIPTPTIPEPSTYALMGLGLVGITLASRRRRAH